LKQICFASLLLASAAYTQDLPGSKDPPGTKRYAGSELIGYRAPKFEEYILPLGTTVEPTQQKYEKSLNVEGQVSRYTYLAPVGRSTLELMRNYKSEFQRLGLTVLYEKAASDKGWFGPAFSNIADEDDLGQILSYNEAQERLLVGKTNDSKPTYYCVFVTAYNMGVIPERLRSRIEKNRALAEVVVISPGSLEEKMEFVNADQMSKSLADSGRIALYGIYFDTDKDTMQPTSAPTLEEIAKLLKSDPKLMVRIVGHTDNQGKPDYNLDLSRRRAASVVRELTSRFGITADRLDAFGCGPYAPVDSNDTEQGRAKNRRVELVRW
jgi:outer membrane protein OmpA-like peptidoglycan-associated protein